MITLFIFKSGARGMQYGIGTYIKELTNALLKIGGIKIFLVSYNSKDYKELTVKPKSECFSEICIPSPFFHTTQNNSYDRKYASVVVRLLSGFISEDGNVVFQINYLDDLQIAIKLKKTYKYPVISVVHFAQWQQLFAGNRKKLRGLNIYQPTNNIEFTLSKEKDFYKVSDHIVSVTRYMKDFLISEYGICSEKITVIPNGLDFSKYEFISAEDRDSLRQRLGFGKEDIIVLFSGRIDPCKGVYFLLEAFEESCRHNQNLKLVLLGQGNILDCQNKLKSSFGKVIYTGFQCQELVTSFYQVADIGIVPSIYDHCPYTVLEMMANKVPLIASRINGLDEILDDYQCMFVNPVLSDEGDVSFIINELSEAILTIAKDKKHRNEIVGNSYRHLIKRFASSQMAEEMKNLFHTLGSNNEMMLEYEKNERR